MIGIDEAGRGCWAGPVVVASVRIRNHKNLYGYIADSKSISRVKRAYALTVIRKNCDIGVGWAWPIEIDSLGLTVSLQRAADRSLRFLYFDIQEKVKLDGSYNYLPDYVANVQCIIEGDAQESSISAASIVAKEARDEYMRYAADVYKGYGFSSHVGYGTKAHMQALELQGPIPNFHRFSYKPIRELL